MMTRERCLAAIDRRIKHYRSMTSGESRLSAWYLVTGYIEAMYDADIITLDEYQRFSEELSDDE